MREGRVGGGRGVGVGLMEEEKKSKKQEGGIKKGSRVSER